MHEEQYVFSAYTRTPWDGNGWGGKKGGKGEKETREDNSPAPPALSET